MREKAPCPICGAKVGSAVALDFHLRDEHPGSPAGANALREAYRRRDRMRAEAAEVRARKTLDHLYRDGCPCGRSLADHQKARAGLAGTGA